VDNFPFKGLFVTGTDTEVGKTFVCALLLKLLTDSGVNATYFKPIATGCSEGISSPEDVAFVSSVSGLDLSDLIHCPIRYQKPLAPLAAARLENRPVSLDLILECYEKLMGSAEFLVVEGVGGLMVPLAPGYLVADLMQELELPALVVTRPTLGTINHTLLTLRAIHRRGIPLVGFVTNGHRDKKDEAAQSSPALIEEFSGVEFLGHIPRYEQEKMSIADFIGKKAPFLKRFVAERILSRRST